jgi:N-acetylmuramoyl-L-alanine amidase
VFISVHFNAVGREAVNGLETYALTPQYQYSTGSGESQPEDDTGLPGNAFDGWNSYLGYTMQRHLLRELGLFDRGLKKARFVMLMGLECPGVLVEGGFISNPEEGKLIATADYRQRLAEAIAGGVEVFNATLKRLEQSRGGGES